MTAEGAAVSIGAAIVSAIFSATVAGLFFTRRKPHHAMWSVGLLMFTAVTVIQSVAELGGWTDRLFKAWYVLGTSLVGFLGAGSVYIVHRRLGHAFAAFVLVVFALLIAVAVATPTNPQAIASFGGPNVAVSGAGWAGSAPRAISPILNVPGALALIGIALIGLIRYRLWYNAYIAIGATVLAIGTGLSRFGLPSLIYAAEFAGITIMFIGFRKAIELAKERARQAPVMPPEPEAEGQARIVAKSAPK